MAVREQGDREQEAGRLEVQESKGREVGEVRSKGHPYQAISLSEIPLFRAHVQADIMVKVDSPSPSLAPVFSKAISSNRLCIRPGIDPTEEKKRFAERLDELRRAAPRRADS